MKLIKKECPNCEDSEVVKKGVLFGWEFEVDGQKQTLYADQHCTSCQSKVMSKEITEEMEQKRKDTLLSKWWYLNEKENFGFKNYETYDKSTTNAKQMSISYVQLFSKRMLREKNMLIMGNPGTGKTHLAKAMARTLKARGFKVGFLTAVDLFNKIKLTYNDKSTERLFKDMQQLDILFIDDIGVETTKVDDVSWSVRTWTEIIESRMGKHNVWTTNLDDIGLPKIIGERAFSRMYEDTRFIDLFTDDYRKKKKVE